MERHPETYEAAHAFCDRHGLKLGQWVSALILEKAQEAQEQAKAGKGTDPGMKTAPRGTGKLTGAF